MGLLKKFSKYLNFSGGIKCLECGNYAEGDKADWYGEDPQAYPTCPECGSGKTEQGILVTKDD